VAGVVSVAFIGSRAPLTLQPSELCAVQSAVAVVVAVEDVPTLATPFVALSASSARGRTSV